MAKHFFVVVVGRATTTTRLSGEGVAMPTQDVTVDDAGIFTILMHRFPSTLREVKICSSQPDFLVIRHRNGTQ